MQIETVLYPINFLDGIPHGYANGYVGVPKVHPWYGMDYDNIHDKYPELSIHGGLTYAGHGKFRDMELNPELWWVGFDTAHSGDNEYTCDKTFCENEVQSLKKFAEEICR